MKVQVRVITMEGIGTDGTCGRDTATLEMLTLPMFSGAYFLTWHSNYSSDWMKPRWINCIFEVMHELENRFSTWSNMLTTVIFFMWLFPQYKHSPRHFRTFLLVLRTWFSSCIMAHEPYNCHWIFVFPE